MASSSKVFISTSERPVYGVAELPAASAELVTTLLQENHDEHHIFFSPAGFHNHTVHHLLTLYALGASTTAIKAQYDDHKKSQRSLGVLNSDIVQKLRNPELFQLHLGKEEHYHDFLEFFRQEIDIHGYEAVIVKYLLSRTDQADDLLCRCFAGFLHPLIHLGFALEYEQPAIIAEALAQAALHKPYLAPFFLGAEKRADRASENPVNTKSLQTLLEDVRANKKLVDAAHWEDDNKIRDSILVRAPDEMIDIASQWSVLPESLEFRDAEMVDAVVSYTMGAQSPPKQIKFDFYFMHCVNCSIFFSSFLKLPWLSQQDKSRLLEWKARNDLVMYASRKAPKILEDEWENYRPKRPGSWNTLFDRVAQLPEDGHACKMLRALAHGQDLCGHFQDRPELRIKGDTWLTLGHMLMDSVEDDGKTWVRSAGFPKAWEQFHDR